MADPAGIRWIEQTGPLELKIHLTDGSSYPFVFPKPEAGPAGPRGQAGTDGTNSSVAGPRGPAGAPGRDGKDGLDGFDGTSIDTATVTSAGQLLISLTNGEIINAGTVVGPAGATGDRGPVGLVGSPGRDGNTILSGYKAPNDAEDGTDGDFYIDLSSPQFDFYGPKRGGAWGGRTTFLKQPPLQENRPFRSMPVGGGSGGGGGSAAQPAIRVPLPPSSEVVISTAKGSSAIFNYRVTATADQTRWSAGSMNLAGQIALIGDEVFSIGSELYGTGEDLDLAWRVSRDPNLDQITIYATAPEAAILEGRLQPYTDT